MRRSLNTVLVVIVSLALAINGAHANEKKPAKETPAPAAQSNAGGNSNQKSNNSASAKVQEPIPAPTPTSQPVEVRGNPNAPAAAANPEPENKKAATSNSQSSNANQGVIAQESPKSEPEKPEQAKPEQAKPEQAKPESVTNAAEKKVSPKIAVVEASAFKSKRLVAGAFAPGRVNSLAKELEKEDADASCGEVSPQSAAKASSNKGKKKSETAKAEESEECKDFILVFSDDASSVDISEAAKGAKGKVLKKFNNVFNGALLNGPPSKILALAKNPKVESIEIDGSVTTQEVYANAVWGLDRSDQRDLPLNTSFNDLGNNAYSIPVYVVDTGIYAEHLEFAGRVAAGASAITDGNGSKDCNGHGTHVAGTIAGSNFGLAKQATLVPVRVLDCSGSGSYSSVIAGLDWIAANHPAGVPGVVNMSLGGPASSSLDSAVSNLISRGITVVVAAGNSGADACNYSPARVPGAITVGATAIDDSRASYSNFGSCIDLFAPGSSVTSAWISSTTSSAIASGTSMASPHVAGAIARFLYTNPTSTPYQASNSLTKSATLSKVINAGANSPNRLLFIEIVFDGTSEPVTTTKPTKGRKSTNTGKGAPR